tara:strand:- start:311 stop:841 length:531 start_codon:yes stop_codon:yes gene_type:complete
MKYKIFSDFFHENQSLFKKHRNVGKGTNHSDNIKHLETFYKVKFPYGHCFPISQFMFYYLGGYGSDYELRCIKKIPIVINDFEFFTSHWFVQNKITGEIIDLSKEQFNKIIDIDKYYKYSSRANFGYPYFFRNRGKRYKNTVPCRQVLLLYEEFIKKNVYLSKTMEFYLKEYKDGI